MHQESQQPKQDTTPPILEDTNATNQVTLTIRTIAKQDVDTIASHLAVIPVIIVMDKLCFKIFPFK